LPDKSANCRGECFNLRQALISLSREALGVAARATEIYQQQRELGPVRGLSMPPLKVHGLPILLHLESKFLGHLHLHTTPKILIMMHPNICPTFVPHLPLYRPLQLAVKASLPLFAS
jgi:hypothetical protein